MKKFFSYLGWILFALAFAGMIYFALPRDNLVDFRGTVDEVSFSESDDCTYIKATGIFDETPTTIKVGSGVSVKMHGGKKMKAADIRPGDMIDLDYKGKLEPGKTITAKWIVVFPHS